MKSIDGYLMKITNKKMLVVFPHPDDESVMAGGIIQRAMSLGYEVTVLTLTEGDRGKIYINGKGRSTAEIRREEMAQAMSKLEVSDWIMWKFDDGKLRHKKIWRERLRKFIEETKPGLIVTYDLSGVTSHPDHISASLEVLRIARKMKCFKLLWVCFEGRTKGKMVDVKVAKYLQKPGFVLNLSFGEAVRKWRASFTHKSQNLSDYVGSNWLYLALFARQEWYSEARLDKKYIYKYKFVSFKI